MLWSPFHSTQTCHPLPNYIGLRMAYTFSWYGCRDRCTMVFAHLRFSEVIPMPHESQVRVWPCAGQSSFLVECSDSRIYIAFNSFPSLETSFCGIWSFLSSRILSWRLTGHFGIAFEPLWMTSSFMAFICAVASSAAHIRVSVALVSITCRAATQCTIRLRSDQSPTRS